MTWEVRIPSEEEGCRSETGMKDTTPKSEGLTKATSPSGYTKA